MNKITQKLKIVFSDRLLRKRIIVLVGALIFSRLLSAVPMPGIDVARLSQFLANNQFFGVLNMFSGGGLSRLSIVMLGVGPYITASIVMQLLTIIVPRLKALYHEEGEIGRKKFALYSRVLTVPLAVLQGLGLIVVLKQQGIIAASDVFTTVVGVAVITAGSLILMWIGELMSEFGIGNGISLLIFAGIVAAFPQQLGQLLVTFDMSQLPVYVLFALVGLLVIAGVVYITEAERSIPVTYARRQVVGGRTVGGTETYLPIRVNQAGVMPIIFALSILMFPQLIGTLLTNASNPTVQKIAEMLRNFNQTGWLYVVIYFIFVILFTYFYTAITFEPHTLAENLQKNGAFIPGIRPGGQTEEYVGAIVTRITLLGALFLGVIAVIPLVVQAVTGITAIAVGGTSILIVVSVILDLIKRVDAQVAMREY